MDLQTIKSQPFPVIDNSNIDKFERGIKRSRRKSKKFAFNLINTYLPGLYNRIMLSTWKKAFHQTWGNPIYFSKAPGELNVTNIGRRSYCANMIDCHHVSLETLIHIGNYTSIGQNLKFIGSSGHSLNSLTTFPFESSRGKKTYKISIGSDVWIGDDVTIIGDIKIGNGCVIGTGSIVTKDLEDFGVYVGSPAKLLKYRFPPNIIQKLKKLSWWDLDDLTVMSIEKHLTSENLQESTEFLDHAING